MLNQGMDKSMDIFVRYNDFDAAREAKQAPHYKAVLRDFTSILKVKTEDACCDDTACVTCRGTMSPDTTWDEVRKFFLRFAADYKVPL